MSPKPLQSRPKDGTPKVSVLTVTYNHEKYIAQAIESVLAQQVDFTYELVIGEDCSTDRTAEIVADYQRRHPDKIRARFEPKNLGDAGKSNFFRTYSECRGEYMALLDGDDYWIDPLKLQKQVDFLDSHPEYVSCGHKAWAYYEEPGQQLGPIPTIDQLDLTLDDFLDECYLPCCSTVFRRSALSELPDFIRRLKMGDWPIHILNSLHGKTRLFPDVMGTYRIHQTAHWSGLGQARWMSARVELYKELDSYLQHKYWAQIRPRLVRASYHAAWNYAREGYPKEALHQSWNIAKDPLAPGLTWRQKLGLGLYLLSPAAYHLVSRAPKETAASIPK